MSLAVTPAGRRPSTRISIVRGRFWSKHWVASTWATSDVPMSKASAPKAPWVLVWLSPQTMVMPGWVKALLGPDDVDDALVGVAEGVERDAEVVAVARQLA